MHDPSAAGRVLILSQRPSKSWTSSSFAEFEESNCLFDPRRTVCLRFSELLAAVDYPLEDVAESRARNTQIPRSREIRKVLRVGEDEAFFRVEHGDPVRHFGERVAQQRLVVVERLTQLPLPCIPHHDDTAENKPADRECSNDQGNLNNQFRPEQHSSVNDTRGGDR